jgi:TRAP-type C4-dicarboxylate transport system permease small subunit
MIVLGLSLLFAVALQVAGRYIPFIPRYLWTLEVTNFSLIWMIFIGSIVGLRDNRHFTVDIFQFKGQSINPIFAKFLRVLYYFVILVITYVFIVYGYQYFMKWGLIQSSDITGINLGWLYASVPFAGISWFIFLIEGFLKEFLKLGPAKEAN